MFNRARESNGGNRERLGARTIWRIASSKRDAVEGHFTRLLLVAGILGSGGLPRREVARRLDRNKTGFAARDRERMMLLLVVDSEWLLFLRVLFFFYC